MPWRGILDPLDRASEVLFGLLMVVTFTGSISVAEAGRGHIRSVLAAAVACNVAWGLVDASMFVMANFTRRARGLRTLNAVRGARQAEEAHEFIRDALPPGLAAMLTASEVEAIRRRLVDLPERSAHVGFERDDFVGAVGVFLLVLLATFPVVVPFIVMHEALPALRVSHAVAVTMLFAVGWSLGSHMGRPGWRIGLVTVTVGLLLALITMALGG